MGQLRINSTSLAAKLRKHSIAILTAAVYNLIFFFPVVFMGRVVSPNDVFWNFDPWALFSSGMVQNSLINDPPTAYYTLMSLLKNHAAAFHWNPYVGSGIPGFGSSASAVLSPFVLLPVMALPLTWSYTAIAFLKLNVAFFFSYLWLREERLGKPGAAIGAIVSAGASVYAVWWLWQATNATALYPAILWVVRRTFRGKRTSIAFLTLLAVGYALAGFPATMAYGVYIAVAYAVFLAIRERRFPLGRLGDALLATALALLIAAPSLVPFVQFVRRSGYLDMREKMSREVFFPPSHWKSFFDPERLGNNATKNWIGDPALGVLNNYVGSTVYVGLAAIVLALLAIANRKAPNRWFWLGAAALIVVCMFGASPIPGLLAGLPGLKYSPLARLVLLLPLPAGYLAGAGAAALAESMRRWRPAASSLLAAAIAIATATDLGVVAGRFHPYLEPVKSVVPSTPTIAFLRAQPGPFRIAAFFNYLWPNSAELFRFEDIRSHFGSEERYRRLLQRIDPTSWGGTSTVIQFNSLKFDFTDPLVGMLGVRYLIEHKAIDIVKWSIFSSTVPGVKETGSLALRPGQTLQRSIRVDAEPFWAIELPASVDATVGRDPCLLVELLKYGAVVYERAFTPADIGVMSKVYIPLHPYAQLGDEVVLRVRSIGIRGGLLKGVATPPDRPLFYGRVKTPIIFDRELPDGRLFLNLAEVPRFHVAKRLRKMSEREFLATKSIDPAQEAVITDQDKPPSLGPSDAQVHLKRYSDAEQRLETESSTPFFLASSEKLTPELQITIDGRQVRPAEINLLFAGVEVPAGQHRVVFSRRIARGWWWVGAAGMLAWIAIAVVEILLSRAGKLRRA